jgi:hypothetical protein
LEVEVLYTPDRGNGRKCGGHKRENGYAIPGEV